MESALVVFVAEAEDLVGGLRARYDPSAARGVPAHVTILYPFKPPSQIDAADVAKLKTVFEQFTPFTASFSRVVLDHGMLYLPPEPKSVFIALTRAMVKAFPDRLPYGGAHNDILPHLTVAIPNDPAELPKISADFNAKVSGKIPFTAQVRDVILMDNSSGGWKVREKFLLIGE